METHLLQLCGVKALFKVTDFSRYPHMAEGARERSLASFIRALISFIRALPSGSNHFPKAPPPNIVSLGVRVSTYEFWEGDTNTQTKAVTDFKNLELEGERH